LSRKTILCFASYYLPGYKSGGPVRSLSNMLGWLREDYDLRIVTRDHDLGDATPYPGRTAGRWYPQDGAQVWYLTRPHWTPGAIRRAVAAARPDLLYFQSFLDPVATIVPLFLRRFGLLPGAAPVVIAPRGELSPGALSLKARKKALFLVLARWLGLYRNVSWHATSAAEAAHIRSWAGDGARVSIAPNLPPRDLPALAPRPPKQKGEVHLVFLSRISPMKNLLGAVQLLAMVKARVTLDVYGVLEDQHYWHECERMIATLPAHVTVSCRGAVLPGHVPAILSRYDAFLLPTLGENFGHAILESLLAGCPVIISDRTPWRDLAANRAGADLPLELPDRFAAVIDDLADMDGARFAEWAGGAREYALAFCHDGDALQATRRLLATAIGA